MPPLHGNTHNRNVLDVSRKVFEDTHRENTHSKKTRGLLKSINMDIWVIGTLNQLFIRGYYNQINLFKK